MAIIITSMGKITLVKMFRFVDRTDINVILRIIFTGWFVARDIGQELDAFCGRYTGKPSGNYVKLYGQFG